MSRILQDADLQPHRQQMYLTSHDDEFREKRDDVLRVYYETPKNEHIVCVDEKTGIQALERRYADIAMKPGQPVRRGSTRSNAGSRSSRATSSLAARSCRPTPLAAKIDAYVAWYVATDRPFRWSYRPKSWPAA